MRMDSVFIVGENKVKSRRPCLVPSRPLEWADVAIPRKGRNRTSLGEGCKGILREGQVTCNRLALQRSTQRNRLEVGGWTGLNRQDTLGADNFIVPGRNCQHQGRLDEGSRNCILRLGSGAEVQSLGS